MSVKRDIAASNIDFQRVTCRLVLEPVHADIQFKTSKKIILQSRR
jgi:hypothetical protein